MNRTASPTHPDTQKSRSLVEVAHELLADAEGADEADFLEQALVLAEQLSPASPNEGVVDEEGKAVVDVAGNDEAPAGPDEAASSEGA